LCEDASRELRRNVVSVFSGSCDRASLTYEKKEPTDDTSKDISKEDVPT